MVVRMEQIQYKVFRRADSKRSINVAQLGHDSNASERNTMFDPATCGLWTFTGRNSQTGAGSSTGVFTVALNKITLKTWKQRKRPRTGEELNKLLYSTSDDGVKSH